MENLVTETHVSNLTTFLTISEEEDPDEDDTYSLSFTGILLTPINTDVDEDTSNLI